MLISMGDEDDAADDLREASLFKLQRRRDKARKTLREHLSVSDADMFLQAIWVMDAIQRGHPNARLHAPVFSSEQAKHLADLSVLNPWTLETLVNEYLVTPSRLQGPRPSKSHARSILPGICGECCQRHEES